MRNLLRFLVLRRLLGGGARRRGPYGAGRSPYGRPPFGTGRHGYGRRRRGNVRVVGCAPGCLMTSLLISVVLTILLNVVIRAF
jgi:hypothetical protein